MPLYVAYIPSWEPIMLNVTIQLDTKPYDHYARGNSGPKGSVEDAIAYIDDTITISSLDANHTSSNGYGANEATIVGTTYMRLAQLTAALYSNENVRSRIRKLRTDAQLINLQEQCHVPTEEEVAAQQQQVECTSDTYRDCVTDNCQRHP